MWGYGQDGKIHHQVLSFHWACDKGIDEAWVGALTSPMDRQQESWSREAGAQGALGESTFSAKKLCSPVLSLLCQLNPYPETL